MFKQKKCTNIVVFYASRGCSLLAPELVPGKRDMGETSGHAWSEAAGSVLRRRNTQWLRTPP